MAELPGHEKLKRELVNSFVSHSSYIGSKIKEQIIATDFKVAQDPINKPSKLRKGDVFLGYSGKKSRPCVVCKVLKDGTVTYIPLTGSENVHCLTESKSRFFGEGCFSKTFDVCTEEYATENFIGVYDNNKLLNKAIKTLKEYINKNL